MTSLPIAVHEASERSTLVSPILEHRNAEEFGLRQEGEYQQQNLAQLRMALDAGHSGSYRIDLSSRMVIWSDELLNIYGMKPGEFGGRLEDWEVCILPEDRKRVRESFQSRIEHGTGIIEYRIQRRDNRQMRWIESRGQVFYRGGSPVRMLGVQTDITERKQQEIEIQAVEEQFREAQKIQAVGRLALGVAHEFNNLLMVIRGYTEMLQEQLPPPDKRRTKTEEVLKATDRAASLTAQLLAFSRKQVVAPGVFDVGELVREASNVVRQIIGQDIELQVSPMGDLGSVKANRDHFFQVLLNLCLPAHDAMSQGGTLNIAIRSLEADQSLCKTHPELIHGNYVAVSVDDCGSGISLEDEQHPFEAFLKTTEQGKTRALGLSTVYDIVKQSGGHVWTDNELGKGTKFTICLPKAAKPVVCSTPLNLKERTKTILVVEDETGLRDSICEYLRSAGYNVLQAASGHDAVTTASKHSEKINVLLTDVIMPKMGGRELSQILSGLRPEMETLFMSGYVDDSVLRSGVESGLAFLQKPFSFKTLGMKVGDLIARSESHAGRRT